MATITKDSNNFVSQWNDKSPHGYNLEQNIPTNQPLYNTSSGIVFDGVNDRLIKIFPTTYSTPNTVFIVSSSFYRSS